MLTQAGYYMSLMNGYLINTLLKTVAINIMSRAFFINMFLI